jgi:hypothetical protein
MRTDRLTAMNKLILALRNFANELSKILLPCVLEGLV